MSKRYSQVERVIYAISNYRNYFNNRVGLEVDKDNSIIKYNNITIGYVVYSDYPQLIITLQESMLPERIRKQIVEAAYSNQILVIFIPIIDIGFGLPENGYMTLKETNKLLKKVSKYSMDDIKTSCCVGPTQDELIKPLLITYNQVFEDCEFKHHAEMILVDFINSLDEEDGVYSQRELEYWFMDLEPCEDCLDAMIDIGATNIVYITLHKEKWNTKDYIQLTNDIQTKERLSISGRPIHYHKEVL